jgi:hypothetical protein
MNLVKYFGLAVFFIFCSCSDNQDVAACDAANKLDNKKSEAREYIGGRWKLIKVFAFRVNNQKVPDIEIQFSDVIGAPIDSQLAEVYENGKRVGSVIYNISEHLGEDKNTYLKINSGENIIYDNGNGNFITGQLRICSNQLLIDNGMAFDAPGYLFEKK